MDLTCIFSIIFLQGNSVGVQYRVCLFLAFKPGLQVRRKHKHKKPSCKPVQCNHKHLVLALVFTLACSGLHVRRNDTSITKHKHKRIHSLVLVLASYMKTGTTQA